MHMAPMVGQGRGMLRIGCRLALGLIASTVGYVVPAAAAINAWTNGGPHGAPVTALAVDTFGHVYAGIAGHGVYMSADHGEAWQPMNIGLDDAYVQSLLVDPAAPMTLYAASPNRGLFRSVDGGQTWLAASNGLPDRSAQHLAIDSASATLFVSTDEGVFRSTDGGCSWSATTLRTRDERGGAPDVSLGAWIDCLTVDPATSTLYACFFDWGAEPGLDWQLLRSTDAGATWQPVSLPGAGGPLAVSVSGSGSLYAVVYDPYMPASRVVESCDAGASWQPLAASFADCDIDCRINALAVGSVEAGVTYAATDHGVYMHDAGGAGWLPLRAGMGDRAATQVAAAGRFIYAATADGVFAMERSADCSGDCNGDGTVTIAELVSLVEIGMGRSSIASCAAGDVDRDGVVDISDLVAAVARTLHGCTQPS